MWVWKVVSYLPTQQYFIYLLKHLVAYNNVTQQWIYDLTFVYKLAHLTAIIDFNLESSSCLKLYSKVIRLKSVYDHILKLVNWS